jgi:hypothetical protein
VSKETSSLEDEEYDEIAQKMNQGSVNEVDQVVENESLLSKVFSLFKVKK